MASSSSNINSHDEEQMLVHNNNEGKLRSKKIDPKISREMLAAAVIKHDLPVSFAEYDGIRAWMKYLNPEAPYISNKSLTSEIKIINSQEKQKIRHFFASMKSGICLTCDIWTHMKEKYICLSGQFVDDDWKLSNKILGFDVVPYPDFGSEVASRIMGFMCEWGINKKVFSLTLDECSSANPTKGFMKKRGGSFGVSLLCEGEFFDIPCLAHTIDTIGQEGSKSIGLVLCKIRDTLEFVKGDRAIMFDGLTVDVPTRWDSTYLVLCSVIKYKRAFLVLRLHDKIYKSSPSDEEWERAEKICEFLELLCDTANLISGSFHPTSNLYFMQVWKIGVMLVENLSSEDAVISDAFRRMKEKFDEYWNQYGTVLACGAVLDPRIKLSMLDFFYSKIESDPIKCKEMISLVKTKLCMIFEHYGKIAVAIEPCSLQPKSSFVKHSPRQMQNGGATKGNRKRIFDEIMTYESQVVGKDGKSQLDHYLEDPKLQFSNYEDLDVLEYWKKHAHIYPNVAIMARAVLAIPITTVASESTFSVGANVLGKYRDCTLPEIVRTIVCTRNWLHGYIIIMKKVQVIKRLYLLGSKIVLDISNGDDNE
ncbi:hypothetical protein CASFOL_004422 [Castilleja foliolosa]|uniref:Transposase n=1 Tax=Castilleja foliolosa TaxID=1961234 RepID=A0ABD3EAD9_9LAMI